MDKPLDTSHPEAYAKVMKTSGILSWSARIVAAWMIKASVLAITVTFSDGTFNLSDYATLLKYQSTAAVTITVSQLATGGNPGTALSTVANDSTDVPFTAKLGLLNNSWIYDPGTQRAVNTIFFSEDKFANLQGAPFTSSSIRLLMKQNGKTYVAATQVPVVVDSWQSGSATFSATDFELWDFGTGTIDPNQHPSFSTGQMQFGLASSPSQAGTGGGPITYTFNFDNTLIKLDVPSPLEVVQTATITGSGYTSGNPKVVKSAINLKTLALSVNVNQGAKADYLLALASTMLDNNAIKRLLVFRKIVGGSFANDIVLLDLSNIDDYNNPQSVPIALALDPAGNGYEIDSVLPKVASLFSGFGGESFTTISKGTPQKRIYDVRMSGTINNIPSVLTFKVGAGKLYVPK